MGKEENATLKRIQEVAIKEFLEKGFKGASLRDIVKKAGVTTGAFYGYYSSKEALFEDLVSETADYMYEKFCGMQEKFEKLSVEEQTRQMEEYSIDYLDDVVDYAYEHKGIFRLILQSSAGTKYENYIHQMVEIEIRSTEEYVARMRKEGYDIVMPNLQLAHAIMSGMLSALSELIVHDLSKEEIRICVKQIGEFMEAGWQKVMGF